jgi:hypothetical protein
VRESLCTFTALQTGDQLLVAFAQNRESTVPASVTIQGTFFTTVPYNPAYGLFHLETDKDQDTSHLVLSTAEARTSIVLPAM